MIRQVRRASWRGWRTDTERRVLPCATTAAGLAAWAAPVAILAANLDRKGVSRNAGDVVLDNSLVRYAVVPWTDGIANADEEAAYVRHHFEQLYIRDMDGWEIRLDARYRAHARLASAVNRELLGVLRRLFADAGIRLASITPQFVDTFNRHAARLSAPDAWLVAHSNSCLCIARWHGRDWISARSFSCDDDWRASLGILLAREACLHDIAGEASTVYLADENPGSRPVVPCAAMSMVSLAGGVGVEAESAI
jgi:hypothetical protein